MELTHILREHLINMGIKSYSLVCIGVGHEVRPVSQALERIVEEDQRVRLCGIPIRIPDIPIAVVPELGRHGKHVAVEACWPVNFCKMI